MAHFVVNKIEFIQQSIRRQFVSVTDDRYRKTTDRCRRTRKDR